MALAKPAMDETANDEVTGRDRVASAPGSPTPTCVFTIDLFQRGSYTTAAELRLHSLAAGLCRSAGWGAFDSGHQATAEKYWSAGVPRRPPGRRRERRRVHPVELGDAALLLDGKGTIELLDACRATPGDLSATVVSALRSGPSVCSPPDARGPQRLTTAPNGENAYLVDEPKPPVETRKRDSRVRIGDLSAVDTVDRKSSMSSDHPGARWACTQETDIKWQNWTGS